MAALTVHQIQALFGQEAEVRLTRLNQLLLELEGAAQDEGLIRSIFREIHTLKGSSAVAGDRSRPRSSTCCSPGWIGWARPSRRRARRTTVTPAPSRLSSWLRR